MKFGEFELFVVSDGTFRMDGGAMFGIVPEGVVGTHQSCR